MAAKLDQRGTDSAMGFLKGQKSSKALMGIGEETKRELIKNWLDSKGGDGTDFKYLTEDYEQWKYEQGHEPEANLMFSGALQRGLTSYRALASKVKVTFLAGERKKAEGNATHRPNMMKLSKKFKNKARKFYQTALDKFLRSQP